MKNYKITVQYDGTRYNGWQKQGNTPNTIQEKFEQILYKLCGKETPVFASGRTDAGVHAIGQVANFKCNTELSAEELMAYLNRYLPSDIAVTAIEEADERFHSRLNAKTKTYEYRIALSKPDVFIRKYVYYAEEEPDLELMRKAAEKLLGKHDFKGFSSVGRSKKSTVRTIHSIRVEEDNGLLTVQICGSGFLYHMVRIIAGTLLEIGTGKLDVSVITEVLCEKTRKKAGSTLPASGLRLIEVTYE